MLKLALALLGTSLAGWLVTVTHIAVIGPCSNGWAFFPLLGMLTFWPGIALLAIWLLTKGIHLYFERHPSTGLHQ